MSEPRSELAAVLATERLRERRPRAPDYQAEAACMNRLARTLTAKPGAILQELAEAAAERCEAGTGGISLIEGEGAEACFRWVALAGVLREYVGGSTPRHASPCGVTIERGSPQLFVRPGRCFPELAPISPPIVEGLVVPFGPDKDAAGTIWVVSHSARHQFDGEDVRFMQSLGGLAASVLHLRSETASAVRGARRSRADAAKLGRTNAALARENADLRSSLRALERVGAHFLDATCGPLSAIRAEAGSLLAEAAVPVRRAAHSIMAQAGWLDRRLRSQWSQSMRGASGQSDEYLNCERALDAAVSRLRDSDGWDQGMLTRGPMPVIKSSASGLPRLFEGLLRRAIACAGPGRRIHVAAEARAGAWLFTAGCAGSPLPVPPDSSDGWDRLAADAGGIIWIEQGEGKGATLCLLLSNPQP
ncbi:MAG TPA: GAF domain-containing protein [Opitutaceae bacterium]|jgi:hypothetical protein|nr:GAF domain-containing protein [Opitutaceae bacterium]